MPPSRSQLEFELRQQRTVLVDRQVELPLAVQRPLRGPYGEAVVTLLMPAGAMFDGDNIHLAVECGPGTDVTLTTASASRLNRCDRGESAFQLRARVAGGATLRYLPCELIPFRGARYRQVLDVGLDRAARAVILEVIGAGQSDDPFAYAQLEFLTQVRFDGAEAVRERFVLAGGARQSLDGYTHYAGMLLLGAAPAAAKASESLASAGVHGAASSLPVSGIVLKALGHAAEPLRQALLAASCCPDWLRPLLPH